MASIVNIPMRPDRPVITCLWFQKKLDDISITCINSWLKLGYRVHIYTYSIGFRNEWINTKYDSRVEVKDGNEIYANNYNISKLEYRSDIFRFNLFLKNQMEDDELKERVIWLDTDQYLIRKLPSDKNYVSSQYTLVTGMYKHKDIRIMPNIGVMSFDGREEIDWAEIINKGLNSRKGNELQSSFLKYYEKIILNTDYAVEPDMFCPIHWAWAKEIYTRIDIDLTKHKYGLKPSEYVRFKHNEKIIGIHLWRQLLTKNRWKITGNSIYAKLARCSKEPGVDLFRL